MPVHHRIDHVRCWANSVHCRQCVSAVEFNHSGRTVLSALKMVRATTESVLRAPGWLLINSFRARILGRRRPRPQRAVPLSKGRQLITFVLVYSNYHCNVVPTRVLPKDIHRRQSAASRRINNSWTVKVLVKIKLKTNCEPSSFSKIIKCK